MSDTAWLDSFRHHLDRFLSGEARNSILEGSERIPDASLEETSKRLKGVAQRSDSLVDEPARTQIMQLCGHEVNRTEHGDPMIAKRKEFETLDEYLRVERTKHDKSIWSLQPYRT